MFEFSVSWEEQDTTLYSSDSSALGKKLTTPCEVESSCILDKAARSENLASREYFVINFRSSDRLRS